MNIYVHKWEGYNYRDIIATFRRMGHRVTVEEWKLEHYDEEQEYEEFLEKELKQEKYDFVFTVNYFAVIAEVCHRRKVPYVSWSCDSPLISMYHETVFYPENFIFLFDRSDVEEWKQMGVEHVYYLPLGVDVERIDQVLANAADLPCYENEVAFVGSLYERNSYDRLKPTLPEYLQGYFEAAMEAQRHICDGNIIEPLLTPDILMQLESYYHLEKSKRSFSNLGLIFSTTVLGFKIASVQRREVLIRLSAQVPVTVYTNSDVQDLLRIRFGGSVDYWSELPKVFSQSKVNLNLTIPNIKSGIPLRVWDVLGAGGFLLTDFQAEFPEYFKNHEDLVWYEEEGEIVELVEYYLRNVEKRRKIAQNGRKKVESGHSYRNRISKMLDILRFA